MFGKSITSWIVTFLVAIGILPGGKSKCRDRIGLLIWLIIVTAASVIWIFFMLSNDNEPEFTVPGLMIFTTTYMTPALQMLGTILSLSTAWKKYPYLVSDDNLALPEMHWLFVLVTLVNMMMFCFFMEPSITQSTGLLYIMSGLSLLLYSLLSNTFTFVIGVCVAQFHKNMERKKFLKDCKEVNLLGKDIITQFSSLKSFLSPVFFVVFLVNALIIIADLYHILPYSSKAYYILPELIHSFLVILYVSLIMDGCYDEFKSLPDTLR